MNDVQQFPTMKMILHMVSFKSNSTGCLYMSAVLALDRGQGWRVTIFPKRICEYLDLEIEIRRKLYTSGLIRDKRKRFPRCATLSGWEAKIIDHSARDLVEMDAIVQSEANRHDSVSK